MVRFLRKWLVPLLAALLLIGIVIAFIPFTRQMETRAQTELTLMMDRAFARIEAGDQLTDPMIAAEQESLLSKAAAVSRFLTHDDTLLASDALLALCEQLTIDRIDVANVEGTLIASSDAASIGTALGTQESFVWTMAAVEDSSAAIARQDDDEPSKLYACVSRSDIEGFVLLTRFDTHVQNTLMRSGAESVTGDMPYGGDVLFPADAGADGFFYEAGNLCLRRTQGDVTLIAARPTAEVFAVRSAAILSFGAALACIMICGVAAYLLRLEPVTSEEGEADALYAAKEAIDEPEQAPELEAPDQEERPRKRRKFFGPREQEEEAQEPAETEPEEQREQAPEHAPDRSPRQIPRARKRAHDATESQQDSEDGFEKIVE